MYGRTAANGHITFDRVLDRVHQRLECCGLMGTGDYAAFHIPIPPSCFNAQGLAFESSCLFKFRLESVYKAQTFAICIYMMGLLVFITFLIDLVLLHEFFRDQLLEQIIDRLSNFSQTLEPMTETSTSVRKPEVQQYIVDYLLENTSTLS